jgi:hypothetical protein
VEWKAKRHIPHQDCRGVSFGVTPRQTCPRPRGLRRNLRSKTRWFTGFCNSHQVSHFATFFIDARAKISVAESLMDSSSIAAQGSFSRPTVALSKQHQCSLTPSGAVGSFGDPPLHQKDRGLCREMVQGPSPDGKDDIFTVYFVRVTTMILPQVHLRKPCYDFSFL